MLEAVQLQTRHLAIGHQRSAITLVAVSLTIATTSLAEEIRAPLSPQFQHEALELKQRQSRAVQGLKLDAGGRLESYHFQMRQRREQQWLQQRQRLQRQGLSRGHTASDTRRVQQQQIFKRQREQQMQRFDRELELWRTKQQNPERSQSRIPKATRGIIAR